jgi:hypothetical protein
MRSTGDRGELPAWILTLGATAAYVYGSSVRGADMFGVDLLRLSGPAVFVGSVVAAIAGAGLVGAINPGLSARSRLPAIACALLSWPVFYALRTGWLNADGNMLTPRFEADVPILGAHLTHDEMLELFLHSRIWYYGHRWWGWSVVHSYQVVSCAAGAVFVYTMIRLAPRLAPGAPWLFVAGAFAGGYMQLFFGDVENYTITAVLVALYVLAACRFLAGDAPLVVPALTLAIAVVFHLEAAWLWPSAVYLAFVSCRRRGPYEATASAGAAIAVVLSTFVYFQFHGLPLMRFFSSHAGHALRMNGVFAVGMPLRYYGEQASLLFLLCPAVGLAAALAAWRRFDHDEVTMFLGVSAASMVLLQLVWKSQIGVLDDWNLYAIGGMLLSTLIWRAACSAAGTPAMRIVAALLSATGWLHTYAWILMNHRR